MHGNMNIIQYVFLHAPIFEHSETIINLSPTSPMHC